MSKLFLWWNNFHFYPKNTSFYWISKSNRSFFMFFIYLKMNVSIFDIILVWIWIFKDFFYQINKWQNCYIFIFKITMLRLLMLLFELNTLDFSNTQKNVLISILIVCFCPLHWTLLKLINITRLIGFLDSNFICQWILRVSISKRLTVWIKLISYPHTLILKSMLSLKLSQP